MINAPIASAAVSAVSSRFRRRRGHSRFWRVRTCTPLRRRGDVDETSEQSRLARARARAGDAADVVAPASDAHVFEWHRSTRRGGRVPLGARARVSDTLHVHV